MAPNPRSLSLDRVHVRAHLAPLTGNNPVMDPRRLVPTDFARNHFDLCWKRKSRWWARGLLWGLTPGAWPGGTGPRNFPPCQLGGACSLPPANGRQCRGCGGRFCIFCCLFGGAVPALEKQRQQLREATCSALQVEKAPWSPALCLPPSGDLGVPSASPHLLPAQGLPLGHPPPLAPMDRAWGLAGRCDAPGGGGGSTWAR